MKIAFAVILFVVVGVVIWFAIHHSTPTSQVEKPAFATPSKDSRPVAEAPQRSLAGAIAAGVGGSPLHVSEAEAG